MKNELSFRRIACLYLDAYCAEHVQVRPMSETEVTQARVLFHTVLSMLHAPVLLTPDQPHHRRRHVLCDLTNLERFVAAFALAYLGFSSARKEA